MTFIGIALEDLDAMLRLLDDQVGSRVTERVRRRTQLDISSFNRVRVCAALVRELGGVQGFPKVARNIALDPNASPFEPHGSWLQLLVAYIFKVRGHEIALERPVAGCPKDVVLDAEKVIVECKSFDYGAKAKSRFRDFHESGQVTQEHPDQPEAFITKWMLWPPLPGVHHGWVSTNHYQRFVTNAVEEKYHQLVEGWCNVLAFNTERISRDPNALREPLEQLLNADRYSKISAFLLLQQEALAEQDYRRGSRVTVLLIERPRRDGITVPKSVVHALQQWNLIGSANTT